MDHTFDYIHLNNSDRIFASFAYSGETKEVIIKSSFASLNLTDQIDFVAIKNSDHVQRGFWLSDVYMNEDDTPIFIWDCFKKISSSI